MAGGMNGRGHAWQAACMAEGGAWQGCACPGSCVTVKTATAVDCTHPTGMHSCLY